MTKSMVNPANIHMVEEGEEPQGDLWITVWGWQVHLLKTDEGILVDVWSDDGAPADEPVATTYAFDSERPGRA